MNDNQGTTNTDLADLMRDTNAKLDKIIADLKASRDNLKKMNDDMEKLAVLSSNIWEK